MTREDDRGLSEFLMSTLRLKTFPIAVNFLESKDTFPEKTRRPSRVLGKRVTVCQAVTMARLYGWTVGLCKEDVICVPAAISFGFSDAQDPEDVMAKLYCDVGFFEGEQASGRAASQMKFLRKGEYEALVLAPLGKGLFEPDTVLIYGNPAQMMRIVQGWLYREGGRLQGTFGGRVECSEYLITPFRTRSARVVIPGLGDRIFSMTQDDEMVFALPGSGLKQLEEGLTAAGVKLGARYPVPFYQNFEPEFPEVYKVLGKELGVL
jgi:uncharacterized protein (DUF169 family)